MKRLIAIASVAFFLAACAVGPNYRAPETPTAVVQNAQSSMFVAQNPEADWWQEVEDTELDGLVRRALAANLDLRMALDRVRAARAVFVERNLDYAPHVELKGA